MEFKVNKTEINLIKNSIVQTSQEVKCRVAFDGVEHLYTSNTDDKKDNAKLAFEIVVQIAQEALGMDCESSDFSLPKGGHMVKIGAYDSWGVNPEASKQRVKSNNFNEVASVEFYIRHALLVLEHQSNGARRLVPSRSKHF